MNIKALIHNFKPVERSKEIQEIVNSLINQQKPNIIALWGSGGCGKTTLALLSCCQQETREYFTG